MKNFAILLMLFGITNLFSQNTEELNAVQKEIYTLENIQVKPEFPEGDKKFDDFVKANFKNSQTKKGTNISAVFIVEMDGSLSNIQIINEDVFGSGKELKRVLEMSPKWLQGEHEGYHVRTKINYTLEL